MILAGRSQHGARWGAVGVCASAVALPAAVAIGILLATGETPDGAVAGLPDPGVLTRWGLPGSRAVRDMATAVTLGALFLAAVGLPTRDGRLLSGPQRRLAGLATTSGSVWLTAVACEVVLTYADAAGQGPFQASVGQLEFFVTEMAIGQQLGWNLLLAAMTTFTAAAARTVGGIGLGAVLGMLGLWAVALTGHAASDGNHDLAVNAQFLHLAGVAVWVGGLLALFWIHRHPDVDLAMVARRYSRLAGWCYAAAAASGLAATALRVPTVAGLLSSYGVIVGFKVAVFVVLGTVGWQQRQRILRPLSNSSATGLRRPLIQLALLELALMSLATGAGVALARTPPPQPVEPTASSPGEATLGRPLPPALTPSEWLTQWQLDTLWAPLALVAALAYAAAVRRLRQRGEVWDRGRSVAWQVGCAGLFWVTSGAPGAYGDVLFSMNVVQYLAIAMLIPMCLTVGAPVTLALRALERREDGSRGPREWLSFVVHSWPVQIMGHAAVAGPLVVLSVIGFYSSSLFEASLRGHTMHLFTTASSLVLGYLFMNAICGIDPAMRRLATSRRLALIGGVTVSLAAYAAGLAGSEELRAADWFTALGRQWGRSPVEDQQLGGRVALGLTTGLGIALAALAAWGPMRQPAAGERVVARRDVPKQG